MWEAVQERRADNSEAGLLRAFAAATSAELEVGLGRIVALH